MNPGLWQTHDDHSLSMTCGSMRAVVCWSAAARQARLLVYRQPETERSGDQLSMSAVADTITEAMLIAERRLGWIEAAGALP